MEKFLIELYECYGSSCEITKKEKSFVIDSMDELEEAMEGYEWLCSDDGKSDYERFIKGEISSASFPHWGDWDEPDSYEIVRTSFQKKLEEIEKEYKDKKQELYEKFGMSL